jgi:hypothetical protein
MADDFVDDDRTCFDCRGPLADSIVVTLVPGGPEPGRWRRGIGYGYVPICFKCRLRRRPEEARRAKEDEVLSSLLADDRPVRKIQRREGWKTNSSASTATKN